MASVGKEVRVHGRNRETVDQGPTGPDYSLTGMSKLSWESSSGGRYWVIELPTVANVLVALDPMSRTVPATSTSMTAIITAYSAMSWPSCCDHNLCIIKCEFPLFLRLVQWLVRGGYRSTECGCYSGSKFLWTY